MKTLNIPSGRANTLVLYINMLLAAIYFSWWLMPGHVGNPYLYSLLALGEAYHVFMAYSFWFTIWPHKKITELPPESGKKFTPWVDIYIPVAGEPVEVIRETAEAAAQIDYPRKRIYILNDGYVAKKDNWKQVDELAGELSIEHITRRTPGGAKAGNINNALQITKGELVAIFDADMVANSDFLKKTVPFFRNPGMGFVQSPQYYINTQQGGVPETAWKQQELFFGPIMRGKEKSNASFICGTNVVIRRKALEEVGGMYEKSIAEDFLTSIRIHQKGWLSHYIPEVLVVGLAPEDLMSYYKQQYRWARGSLQVLVGENPLFSRGLSLSQRLEYLASALYYFNGVVVFIDILMPLFFLLFGWQAVFARTTTVALYFLPFMFFNLLTLYIVSNGTLNISTFSYTHSSWYLHLRAFLSTIFMEKSSFVVTPKRGQKGNFIHLAFPHILYFILVIIGSTMAISKHGLNPSVATNIAWALINVLLFIPFIKQSYPWEKIFSLKKNTPSGAYLFDDSKAKR